MPAITPRLGELLVKTTKAKDIDDAFQKVLRDYVELKMKSLQDTITKFESKWELSFEEFKTKINDKTLKKDIYSFDVEQDFWLWEEAETLKDHYEDLQI